MPTASLGTNWLKRLPAPVGASGTSTFILSETVASFGSASDTLKLVQVPKGVTVGGGCFVQISDVDTNATPTFVFSLQITDGTTTKTIIHQATTGQTGGLVRSTKIPATENGVGFVTDNSNYWIQILTDTAQATGASGTLVYGIQLDGFYRSGTITYE